MELSNYQRREFDHTIAGCAIGRRRSAHSTIGLFRIDEKRSGRLAEQLPIPTFQPQLDECQRSSSSSHGCGCLSGTVREQADLCSQQLDSLSLARNWDARSCCHLQVLLDLVVRKSVKIQSMLRAEAGSTTRCHLSVPGEHSTPTWARQTGQNFSA